MTTREIGELGERQGLKHLKKAGYKIVEKNFRAIAGEIDIIARDKGDLVFVEIKLRTTSEFGTPGEAVDARKQGKIIRSALQYVKTKKISGANIRFDVLSIGPGEEEINLIKNAFLSTDKYTY
jgi:putative endonuclease